MDILTEFRKILQALASLIRAIKTKQPPSFARGGYFVNRKTTLAVRHCPFAYILPPRQLSVKCQCGAYPGYKLLQFNTRRIRSDRRVLLCIAIRRQRKNAEKTQ
jgi:hypothetical protein